MFFNATDHAHIPVQFYDGDGILITNAIEINTVTGLGLCLLDLDKQGSWPKISILSLDRYVGSSLAECRCQWRPPIRVTSFSGCELKDESQVMMAIRFDKLKKMINSQFNALAEHQSKTFQRLAIDFLE